jgi:hypothetical protein
MSIKKSTILTSCNLSTLPNALFGVALDQPNKHTTAQSFLVESERNAPLKSFYLTANIQYDTQLPDHQDYSIESARKTFQLRLHDVVNSELLTSIEEDDIAKRHAFASTLQNRIMNQAQFRLFEHLCQSNNLPLIVLEALILNPGLFKLCVEKQSLEITPFASYFHSLKLPRLCLIDQTLKFLVQSNEMKFTTNAIKDFKCDGAIKKIFDAYYAKRYTPYSVSDTVNQKFFEETEVALHFVLKETYYELMLNTHNRESYESKVFANIVHNNGLKEQKESSVNGIDQTSYTPLYFDNAIRLLDKLKAKEHLTSEDAQVYIDILETMNEALQMITAVVKDTALYYTL